MNDTQPSQAEVPHAVQAKPRAYGRVWLVVGVVLVLIAGVIGWTLLRSPGNAPANSRGGPGAGAAALPVVAAPVRKGTIDVHLSALGTVTPRATVVVHTRVDGQLMSVAFREGQLVHANDLLGQIDPRPFQVQLTQAEGQMAHDQALLKDAQLDLERYRTLLKQDSIASQQVDTQEALLHQYQGQVQTDQGAIDNAKLQLTYSRVVAPITGRVGLRQVDPGNIVHASDSNGFVTITQEQPMDVVYPVAEDDLPRIVKRMQSKQDVPVDAYDRSGRVHLGTGHLLTIDNQIDTTTGTVKLKAEFPNRDDALFPNQFVNIRMVVETRMDVTLVPSAAIQRGAPGTFVFLVKPDQTVAMTPVKLGAVEGETTELQTPLDPGSLLVVDGADKLRDGSKVQLVDASTRAAAPGAATPAPPDKGQPGANNSSGDKRGRSKSGG
jgi:membrane fusion protein, multidrug efflux system